MERIRNLIFGHPVIPFSDKEIKEKGKGFYYRGQEFIHHSLLLHEESAFHRLSRTQSAFLILAAIAIVFSFILNWHLTLVVTIAILTTLYFSDLLFNLYLIYRSFSKPAEIKISDQEVKSVSDWPTYTILCPLYREWQVLPQFVDAIGKLEYPKEKLQVLLLLEEDDQETINKAKYLNLPDHFEIVIVPDSKPKTKPKACNYGLSLLNSN